MPKLYFVLGGPGCGKGTQCNLLAKNYNFLHLSAGQLLRNASQNPLINDYLLKGTIVPSHITLQLLKNEIEKSDVNSKILIDGFPRNQDNLQGFLKSQIKFESCIYIQLPYDQMLQRIIQRKEGRTDDNEYIFQKRIDVFEKETLPVINWFRIQNKLIEIDGQGQQEQVNSRIKSILFDL